MSRKHLSVGMKQSKQEFDEQLKTYSVKALENVINIAEKSLDQSTRLKANMFLIEKAVGKDYRAILPEQTDNDTTHLVRIITVNSKHNIDNNEIENEIKQTLTQLDSEPWNEEWEGNDIYTP